MQNESRLQQHKPKNIVYNNISCFFRYILIFGTICHCYVSVVSCTAGGGIVVVVVVCGWDSLLRVERLRTRFVSLAQSISL